MSGTVTSWQTFWEKYDDPDILIQKSENLDATLRDIESSINRKLLSGDHLLIIAALEERIEELESPV